MMLMGSAHVRVVVRREIDFDNIDEWPGKTEGLTRLGLETVTE